MTVSRLPANLPDLLRKQGLDVIELPGWRANERPRSTGVLGAVGTLWHHTGSFDGLTDARNDLDYAKWLAFRGRPEDGIPAPLCQVSISAEGRVYLCAGGRANHAGKARASGSVAAGDGNTLYIGIECMNSGKQGWGRPQIDAMLTTGAVLHLHVLDTSVRAARGHRETSVTGKWDPGMLNLDKFRLDLDRRITEIKKPRKTLPHFDDRAAALIRQAARPVLRPKVKSRMRAAATAVEKHKPLP